MMPSSAKTVHYKNDLRRLTAVIGAALALFGAVLLAIVAYAGWSANRTAVVRERQLVENALDQSVSSVLDQQKAIAWWDDAVVNAQRRPARSGLDRHQYGRLLLRNLRPRRSLYHR